MLTGRIAKLPATLVLTFPSHESKTTFNALGLSCYSEVSPSVGGLLFPEGVADGIENGSTDGSAFDFDFCAKAFMPRAVSSS
jgi:hypothetical protein